MSIGKHGNNLEGKETTNFDDVLDDIGTEAFNKVLL